MHRTNAVALGLLVGALAAAAGPGWAQEDLRPTLTFERTSQGDRLAGWTSRPPEGAFRDSIVVQGGRYAGRLESPPPGGGGASILTLALPVTFSGETLQLRGWLRTEGVTGFAGLWLREDGRSGPVQFDNMQQRGLSGTTGWTQYTVTLPLDKRARQLYLGALLAGEGTVWVDELELLVDGAPSTEAPALTIVKAPAELDTEFDSGSGIDLTSVTPLQVENLTLLGKVWGLAKYHHPRVAAGEVNWDYELFRVLPRVLDAGDRRSAAALMAGWLTELRDPPPCLTCWELPGDFHLHSDVDWVGDVGRLGPALSQRLSLILKNRSASPEQYYVSHQPGVGNPDFSNEMGYRERPFPDAGFRLLALYRFWNIIEYWFPYRDLIDSDWGQVLAEFVPRLVGAEDAAAYRLELMQLVAQIHDTHANLWGDLALRPPQGDAQLPVFVRFIEDAPVVTGYSHAELGPATGLRVGDVIETLDGVRVDSLVSAWRPYYAASNEPTRLRDMARTLTRGALGPIRVTGRRAEGPFDLTATRVPVADLDPRAGLTHDLPGETFQRLSDEVAYLKLSSVASADVENYLSRAQGAKVLVVDIRNYPSEFVVFSLGGHLVRKPTEFARFTTGDAARPGAFAFTPPLSLQPQEPFFDGTVVILVDEVSQSQAEYTTMALRTAPRALVVGSTTAGADGNVSPIPLPGGVNTMMSGIGVFYPDRSPTQRVGIIPDLEVRPTLEGIRRGRDEVLEAGVSRALGRPFELARSGEAVRSEPPTPHVGPKAPSSAP